MATNQKLEKLKYRYNLILIAGLCSMTLAPCVIFYFRGIGELMWLAIFLMISYIISLFPKKFYNKIQLSKNVNFYKKLGVHQFKKFSTNGDFININIKKSFPKHRNVKDLTTIKAKLEETYIIEKSHTVLFAFCFLTTIYAILLNKIEFAVFLSIGNFLFNLYPNLLQQYNRIRYRKALITYDHKFSKKILKN